MSEEKKTQAIGKFLDMSFNRKGDKKRSERYYIQIPPQLVHNSDFPFENDEPLMVRLEGQKLVLIKLVPVE